MSKIVGKIVLTGGPCAGKTTALARIKEDLEDLGYHVLTVSESATELIQGGIKPFGKSKIDMFDFEDEKCVVIYDRGVMDNKAYVNSKEFARVIEFLNLSRIELLDRYDMVFHLVTAADGALEYYTLENNQARSETKEEAKALDKRAMEAWNGHDNLIIIDNKTEFEEKLQRVLDSIHKFLKEPISLFSQKKYLVEVSREYIESISFNPIDIEQYYLVTNNGNEKRLRKRTQKNRSTYCYTVLKKCEKGLSKVVTDEKISEQEFLKLLDNYKVGSKVKKTRYSFFENNQYFKLDIFDDGLAILQIDTTDESSLVKFPHGLKVLEEVTDNIYF